MTFFFAAASVGNPVDMIASASPEHYRRSLEVLIDDDSTDDILVIYIPVQPTDAPEVAAAIRDIGTRAGGETILATFMSAHGVPEPLAPVPSFAFPERAVAALARAADYAEWRRRPEKESVPFALDEKTLRNAIDNAIERGGGWLDPAQVDGLLRAAGINTPGGEPGFGWNVSFPRRRRGALRIRHTPNPAAERAGSPASPRGLRLKPTTVRC